MTSSASSAIKINQHLFQIYPSMPKYAADPSQSQIIKTYDHLMLRFAGHYGRQPQYFVKAPLSAVLFGDPHSYVGLPFVTFNSSQSIIIAISRTNSKKIRLNHYQTTLYGELELSTTVSSYVSLTLPPEQPNQSFIPNSDKIRLQQQNLITSILKVFAQTNNMMELPGMDILVYKDFVEEKFLYSQEAFVYGMYTAVHVCGAKKVALQEKVLHKAFQKILDSTVTHVEGLQQLVHGSYNNMTLTSSLTQKSTQVKFPQGYSLIIANSITPQPKKLIKGKRFNLRECQIQIAIQLIMSQLGIVKQIRSINQLMSTIQCDVKEILQTVESTIPAKTMSVEQIEGILQRPLSQVLKHIQFASNVIDENVEFHPYHRIKFFLQQQLLITSLTTTSPSLQTLLKTSFVNATTHLSITSQQIEDIQKISSQFGAVTKVLGNGWGGCVAILCKQEVTEKLYQELVEKFYLAEKNRILLGDDIEVYLKVVGKPQGGLAVLDPTNEIWFG